MSSTKSSEGALRYANPAQQLRRDRLLSPETAVYELNLNDRKVPRSGVRFRRQSTLPGQSAVDLHHPQSYSRLLLRLSSITPQQPRGVWPTPPPSVPKIVEELADQVCFIFPPLRWVVERTFAWLGLNRAWRITLKLPSGSTHLTSRMATLDLRPPLRAGYRFPLH